MFPSLSLSLSPSLCSSSFFSIGYCTCTSIIIIVVCCLLLLLSFFLARLSTGKPNGSVNILLTAKHVSRIIIVDVIDVVFYSQKLMNAGTYMYIIFYMLHVHVHAHVFDYLFLYLLFVYVFICGH